MVLDSCEFSRRANQRRWVLESPREDGSINRPTSSSHFLGGLEVEATDRVLHRQLVLELERDTLGTADDEKVVGHLLWVGRAGPLAMSGEKLVLALERP